MNRIAATLDRLKAEGKKMLSPYITAGDLELNFTLPLMHELVKAGADILEIGLPFSDPFAEGPVIQAAMERALHQGMNWQKLFLIIEDFRKTNDKTPLVLMGYLNPIEQYGYERFAKRAQAAGLDGTIIVDLPPEESGLIAKLWQAHHLYSIYLCSPTTSMDRMHLLNQYASGYLYYVSLKGVTGADNFDLDEVKKSYLERKSQTNFPLMVGFGIKTPQMAANVAKFADGVIIGAALIEKIAKAYHDSKEKALKAAATLIGDIRQQIDKGVKQ